MPQISASSVAHVQRPSGAVQRPRSSFSNPARARSAWATDPVTVVVTSLAVIARFPSVSGIEARTLAGGVVGQEVEQHAGLLAAQLLIERTARRRVFDGHDDLSPVEWIVRSRVRATVALLGVS